MFCEDHGRMFTFKHLITPERFEEGHTFHSNKGTHPRISDGTATHCTPNSQVTPGSQAQYLSRTRGNRGTKAVVDQSARMWTTTVKVTQDRIEITSNRESSHSHQLFDHRHAPRIFEHRISDEHLSRSHDMRFTSSLDTVAGPRTL